MVANGELGRVYFWVPPGAAQFSLFAKAEGQAPGRGGNLTVYSPDGQSRGSVEGDLGTWTEMAVPVPPEAQGRVWALDARDLTNDLQVYLTGDASEYVSADPGRVLSRP